MITVCVVSAWCCYCVVLSILCNVFGVAYWLKHTLTISQVEVLDISQNDIGTQGAQALVAALSSSNLKTLVFGPKATRLDLRGTALVGTEPEPEDEAGMGRSVDLSKQELGDAGAIIVAWWLRLPCNAGGSRLDAIGKPITGVGVSFDDPCQCR